MVPADCAGDVSALNSLRHATESEIHVLEVGLKGFVEQTNRKKGGAFKKDGGERHALDLAGGRAVAAGSETCSPWASATADQVVGSVDYCRIRGGQDFSAGKRGFGGE